MTPTKEELKASLDQCRASDCAPYYGLLLQELAEKFRACRTWTVHEDWLKMEIREYLKAQRIEV